MQELDGPLSEDGDERAGVFLTNALTGWEPTVQKPLPSPNWSRSGNVPSGEAGHAGCGHPGQPALQRLRRRGVALTRNGNCPKPTGVPDKYAVPKARA